MACPKCRKGHLRKHKGSKGSFWGCSQYPDCRVIFDDNKGKPKF
ncbi:topoisomerase DNA-binding C4 zinc finger domain-containing protein [Anaerospora hongkongensis]